MVEVVTAFHEKFGMPATIGCVDGTHIPIRAPNEEEWAYVNRKGGHSINVQVKFLLNPHGLHTLASVDKDYYSSSSLLDNYIE
jgi:hypothetical protein